MYLFKIKAEVTDIDVPAARALLSMAVLLVISYRNNNHLPAFNIAAAIIILLADLFAATLLVKFRINLLILVGGAAVVLAITTQMLVFALLLIVFAVVIKYSYVQPSVDVSPTGIVLKKTFHHKKYPWRDFSNIILKDNLLTLDFKNNKVVQLELDSASQVNEQEFNSFCTLNLL